MKYTTFLLIRYIYNKGTLVYNNDYFSKYDYEPDLQIPAFG